MDNKDLINWLFLIATIICFTIIYMDIDKRITMLEEKKPAYYVIGREGKELILREIK